MYMKTINIINLGTFELLKIWENNNIIYSLIISFFNEEKTLEISVQNLLKEDFASEIILVNDGSYDKSLVIAKEL